MKTMSNSAFQRDMDFERAADRRSLPVRVKEDMERVAKMLEERRLEREAREIARGLSRAGIKSATTGAGDEP